MNIATTTTTTTAVVDYNGITINGEYYPTPLTETGSADLPAGWDYHFDSDEGARCFKFNGKRRWVDNHTLNEEGEVTISF